MYKINIKYDNKIIENKREFDNTLDKLKLIYGDLINFEITEDDKFKIIFNNKVIYSLEDSFDSTLLIDEKVLNKIDNYIENAIKLNKSKDISAVDDIWIDDF